MRITAECFDKPGRAMMCFCAAVRVAKILKQNDIQLIAPGHKITPEITSRFGVNYLLNQDILQDGRMRVVIKDVRVEEEEDRMRFLDAEQLAMF